MKHARGPIAASALLVLSGCATEPSLPPGEVISFAPPLERPCREEPVFAPIPFKPASLVSHFEGLVFASVRYVVRADGSVDNAAVTAVGTSADSRALSHHQVTELRQEIPAQINSVWQHEPGITRACESVLSWNTVD